MSEQEGSRNYQRSHGGSDSHRPRRNWLIAGSVAGAVLLLGGTGAFVYARDAGWHHGWGGGMHGEFIADRIEGRVDDVLSNVDATAEQKAQVTSILQAAASDVHALAEQHSAIHRRLHEVLSAETVDRAALETVRADGLLLADQASKRLLDGIADAAEVLSPEQRAALAQRAEQHRHWHD